MATQAMRVHTRTYPPQVSHTTIQPTRSLLGSERFREGPDVGSWYTPGSVGFCRCRPPKTSPAGPSQIKTNPGEAEQHPALVRNNPADKMKLLFLVAVALSGSGCPSHAFVPKVGVPSSSTRILVEPWAAARRAQPRGVSMKSQATPVKVEVSL